MLSIIDFPKTSFLEFKIDSKIKATTILLAFFIPISTSITSVVVSVLFILCMVNFRLKNYHYLLSDKSICMLISYILLNYISVLYSSGSTNEILHSILKVSRLWLIPLLAPYFSDPKQKNKIINVFLLSILLSFIVILLKKIGMIEKHLFGKSINYSFKDSIFTSFIFAIVSCILHNKLLTTSSVKKEIFINLGLVSILYYLNFLCIGRTGQIISISMLILFFIQYRHLKISYFLFKLKIPVFITLLSVFVSSSFSSRMNEIFFQYRELNQVDTLKFDFEENSDQKKAINIDRSIQKKISIAESSLAIRLEMFINSINIVKKNYFIGYGIGSFRNEYNSYMFDRFGVVDYKSNPHNQYILILVDTGILGLLLYMAFIISILYKTILHDSFYSKIIQGFIFGFSLGAFANSWLSDFSTLYLFIIFVATLVPFGYADSKNN